MALPLPLLQKRRRRLHGALLYRPQPGGHTHVPDGAIPGTDDDDRRPRCLPDSAALQR